MKKNDNLRLKDILSNDLCVGCGACSTVLDKKLVLVESFDGYLRPQEILPLTPHDEEIINSVCPGISIDSDFYKPTHQEIWGPIVNSHIGWSLNTNVRHKASSGGGISAIAAYLLEKGHADAVLHIGSSDNDPLKNEYKISTTPDQVYSNSGSRYAPAAPVTGLNAATSSFNKIVFIGKPCDIVAVRKIGQIDTKIKNKIYCCISFMCAGVPSMKGTHAVLNALGTKVEEVKTFQYRGDGWPGLAKATTHSGDVKGMTYDDSWGKILNKHLQFRCKICIDGTGESADITCADAWHGDAKGYPSFEEQQGRSLVISRTSLGDNIVVDAVKSMALGIQPIDQSEIEKMQPYQSNRKKLALSRILALKILGRVHPQYNIKTLSALSLKAPLKENLKSFLGTIKRAVKK